MRILLDQAASQLLTGKVVAVPTETVYGLAACIDNPDAVQKVFELKKRPPQNPLIIHIANLDQLKLYTDASFEVLSEAFWPGPLTLVLPVRAGVISEKVTAGLRTAAFRMPKHSLARELIARTGPLVMPSANLSGRPSSTTAEHVESDFGDDFFVLDGGPCECGVESTIMIQENGEWVIIRQGILVPEDFARVLGYPPKIDSGKKDKPICPGQMFRHYAPKAKLIPAVEFGDKWVLGFIENRYPNQEKVIYLGSLKQPETIAENLYSTLRYLDEQNISEAYVDMRFEEEGLLKTIGERLRKAASG